MIACILSGLAVHIAHCIWNHQQDKRIKKLIASCKLLETENATQANEIEEIKGFLVID